MFRNTRPPALDPGPLPAGSRRAPCSCCIPRTCYSDNLQQQQHATAVTCNSDHILSASTWGTTQGPTVVLPDFPESTPSSVPQTP
jgi:hypothetical protein